MSATGFNRVRRLAAERLGTSFEEVSYDLANEVLQEPVEAPPRDAREAELRALDWTELKDLLEVLGLDAAKPKGVSWADFGIPQVLEYEGL